MRRRIYLDHNATRPLLPAARAALVDALELVGNPSSVHAEGRAARSVVEKSRSAVAALVSGAAENVAFTGSATEAAVTLLSPHWMRDGRETMLGALAVCDADHPATREGGRFAAETVTRLPVDANGIVDLASLTRWVEGLGARPAMLALCLANNETGVIQPLEPVREVLAGRDVMLVLDVVQAAGRLPLDMETLGADALILSGHKMGAAKGVGAFVLRNERTRPFRLISGGGQEKGLRSGTEAVPAIASFGPAALAAAEHAGQAEGMRAMRKRLGDRLADGNRACIVLGRHAARLANTLAIALPGVRAETVQIALDLEGFAVSAGSACSSGKVGRSHVLAAMAAGGLDVDPALGLVRVSMGETTTEADVDAFAGAFLRAAGRVRGASRRLEAA